jgi:hypothetical protein
VKLNRPVLIFSAVFLFHNLSFGKIIYWPEACESGQIKIKNNSPQTVSVWLQKFSPLLENETEFSVAPQALTIIKTEKSSDHDRFSLLTLSKASMIVTYDCGGTTYPSSSADNGILLFKRRSHSNKLWIRNLFSGLNHLKVEILDAKKNVIESSVLSLSLSESLTKKLSEASNWEYLRIGSSYKFSAFLIGDDETIGPQSIEPFESSVESGGHYFLIGPRTGDSDNFVVRVDKPELLEKARLQLKNPSLEKIVFAKIQKDHQGINRNFNSNGSFWSWSATEVTGFGDFGSTSCNGHPQMLEDRLDAWLENPGQICFWSYRVKRELTSEEISKGTLNPVKKP